MTAASICETVSSRMIGREQPDALQRRRLANAIRVTLTRSIDATCSSGNAFDSEGVTPLLDAAITSGMVLAGHAIGICGRPSRELINLVVRCIEAGVAFLCLDTDRAPEERLAIARAIGLRLIVETGTNKIIEVEPPLSGSIQLLGAMYLVRSSGTSAQEPKCFAVSYAAFGRLRSKVSKYLRDHELLPEKVHIINKVEFGFFLWDILLLSLKLRDATLYARSDLLFVGTPKLKDAVSCTPSMLEAWLAAGIEWLPAIIYLSGERLSGAHVEAFQTAQALRQTRLVTSYALTETGGQVTLLATDASKIKKGEIGLPLLGCSIELGPPDAEGRCSVGVRTDTAAFAKIDAGGLTFLGPKSLIQTDDLATVTASGTFSIIGRAPARPKRLGVLVDFEQMNREIIAVTGAIDVCLEELTGGGTSVVAATIMLAEPNEWSAERLFAALPYGIRPDLAIFTRRLHLGPNGKGITPVKDLARSGATSPRETLVRLRKILAWIGLNRVAAAADVPLYDHDIGSRDMLILREAISVLFNRSLPLVDLYQTPDLLALAAQLAQHAQTSTLVGMR